MKVSINWLKELVNLKVPIEELIKLLPLRTIGLKEISKNYLELDMKGYNRADLLSLRGVATEIAAITDSTIKFKDEEPDFPQLGRAKVEIANGDLCPVYCVAQIENLKVENSNDTWVKKLNDSGIRTVNNIADVTNLVMLEYGQPLHAFDASTVEDETIVVRTAKDGEKLVTLDSKERVLSSNDLLITDPKKAIGLAGVMGGKNTEISSSTSTILLEAAIFDPKTLRKTATRLGLVSEASKRFYHGLTKKRLLQAFAAAIKMYEALGGKLTTITLTGNLEDEPTIIKLTQEKVNSLIGIDISTEQIGDSLKKLGFALASQGDALRAWEVTVPYWRLDINIEEDLIEEVARMYGYEKIPAKALGTNIPSHTQDPLFELLDSLKKALVKQGLTEVQTYSYYSAQVIKNLKMEIENLIRIANPISSETEYMRDNLWPNLLEAAAKNIRNGIGDIAIFELGKVYSPQKGDLPNESYHLAIALCNGTDNPIQELYQIAQATINHHSGLSRIDSGVAIAPQNDTFFHPTRVSSIGQNGFVSEIHPRYVNKFGMEQRVAVLEIIL